MSQAFKAHKEEAEDLLAKRLLVANEKTMAEAGISSAWMVAYAQVAERCDRDCRYGIKRYSYEAGASVGAFTGGFFDRRKWGLRKGLERHQSMRAVAEYEAKYINAAGY